MTKESKIDEQINVLLVEDDDVDSEAVLRYVRAQNLPYHVTCTRSAREAGEYLKDGNFDVVLLDYNLGNGTGLDVLPDAGDAAVVIITGSGSEKTAAEAMRLGASDYIVKDTSQNYLSVLPLTIRSVMDRRRARRELEELRHLLSDIINSMPSILVGVDTDGRVTRWNHEAEHVTRVMAADALGRFLSDIFPQLEGQVEKVATAIQKGLPQREELTVRPPGDGARLWNITVYPLKESAGEGAVIRVDDVTERVRLEAMMVHSEKMMSVGGLAAGMAHELNNPLAGILHNTQVMRNRLETTLPRNRRTAEALDISMEAIETYMSRRGIFDMMDNVLDAGKRAAHIVNNLLTFSGTGDQQSAPHDLGHLLDRALALAANDFQLRDHYRFKSIDIRKEYFFPLPKVLCESGKIQQVFYNIIKNAAQAMHQSHDREKRRLVLRVKPDNGHVRVEIEDNGPGMEEETLKRIFEPFFTTRNVGAGVGLGLSVCFFIVTRDHKGELEVKSEPGRGALFIVRLPLDRRSAGNREDNDE